MSRPGQQRQNTREPAYVVGTYPTRGRLIPNTIPRRGESIILIVLFSFACTTQDASRKVIAPATNVIVPQNARERLAGAVRVPTISHTDSAAFNPDPFVALHTYLQEQFPKLHATLQRETVGTYSLLYKWAGSDPSLQPILLLGHLDVVPVEPSTTSRWEHGPFSGVIQDGYVWGRGAIDNKSAVVGTLEAIEMLLTDGFQPSRTVYLAFGHDEEVGGNRGAQKIAELLRRRGVQFEMIVDEGGVIADGVLPDVKAPTAMIGVAEKGFANIELNARSTGGHSSLPPRETAIGILSRAIVRVEQNQMPARLEGATREMFNRIAPEFPFMKRVAFAHLWLTRPLVIRKLESIPTTNAMIRTTTAVTVFQAGIKENALPTHARAVINFRILPGDSVSGVLKHVQAVVDDPRVESKLGSGFWAEASAMSSTDAPTFKTLERTIQSLAPNVIVAPYLVVVVTDSRHYADLSRNVFRFLPVRLQDVDVPRLHGLNERIAIRDYEWAIKFYRQLILNMTRI